MAAVETPIQVKVSTSFPSARLARQIPVGSGRLGQHGFAVDDTSTAADWWIVSSNLTHATHVWTDPNHTIFVSNEPPGHPYSPEFLNQFAYVWSCDPNLNHPQRIPCGYGLPWWVGLSLQGTVDHHFGEQAAMGYADFVAFEPPQKEQRLSVITSRKSLNAGHRLRLAFLDRLKELQHPQIDFYGYDSNPIADKWQALQGYAYHLAIENYRTDDYWTEKFTDPLLAYTLPIYHGCKNIRQYFPEQAYLEINLEDAEASIRTIVQCLEHDSYRTHVERIREARSKVLGEYNFFNLAANFCKTKATTSRWVTLLPNEQSTKRYYWAARFRLMLSQLSRPRKRIATPQAPC